MEFLVITISNLIWMFYCLTEGVREGFFNHYKNTFRNRINYNFKKMFLLQRLLVLLATGGIMLYTIGTIGIPFVVGQVLMFHFIHKLSYNCVEKKIEERVEISKKEKLKEPMMILGISIQIFIYLFFI